MKKILFVCQANIGRSQMAEAFFNQLGRAEVAISAACEDFREKYQGKITAEIVETMAEVGIDISHQRIKLLTPAMVEEADRVVVLCDKQYCPDFLIARKDKVIVRTLEDPHQLSAGSIAKIRDQIRKLVEEI